MINNIRFDIYLGKSYDRWKYWNTSLKVLQYFLRSTEVIP